MQFMMFLARVLAWIFVPKEGRFPQEPAASAALRVAETVAPQLSQEFRR
jgi:hypothetical protein